LFWSLCYLVLRRLPQLAALRLRSEEFKELEIVVLRHELGVLRRQLARPELRPSDRVFLAAASRLLPRARWRSFVVTPTTLLSWHRGWSRTRATPRARESALGLPTHRRRAPRAGRHSLRQFGAQRAAPGRPRACGRARRTLVARVPAHTPNPDSAWINQQARQLVWTFARAGDAGSLPDPRSTSCRPTASTQRRSPARSEQATSHVETAWAD
jgi:hypothetical protein